MKAHYKTPYECPAFNYYKADEDVSFLLVNKEPITELEQIELMKVHLDLKEWFSANYNRNNYKSVLDKHSKKLKLENKLLVLNYIKKTIEAIKPYKLSETISEINLDKLKKFCKDLSLPFIDLSTDMVSAIDRYVKGVTNDYNRLTKELDRKENDFNYIRECLSVAKALGMQIEPMKITLAEWLELIKMAENEK